jgi:hypothetical protein
MVIGVYWNALGIAADYNAAPFLDRFSAVVMLFTHRLKVIRVIEFDLITFVRLYMIHYARHHYPAHCIAVHAQRVTG